MLRRTLLLVLAAVSCLPVASSADLARLDPRARIALAELRAGRPVKAMLESGASVNAEGELDVFIRGDADRAALEGAGARVRTAMPGLFTAFVPVSAIERVASLPAVRSIRGAAILEPELDASVPATGANALRGPGPAFAGLNGQGVLVGVVDTGIDHSHGDFEDATGHTRIVRLWDQTVSGAPPAGYAYGAEWTSAQIDAGACTEVDVSGHGSNVASVAAGDGSQTGGGTPAFTYAGMAPRAPIVVVKSNSTDTGVLDAVRYCFELATARGENAVVNLSIGTHFGPHDGTSAFESGLSALTGPGRIIVKSAGNDRAQPRHAELFAAGAGTSVTLNVSGSAPGRLVSIDGYYASTENLDVRVTTPGGTVIGPVPRGASNAPPGGTPTPNGNVYLENGKTVTATGDYEVYLHLAVQSGQDMNGTWTITFDPVALGAHNGEVDLWRFASSGGVAASFVAGNQAHEELITEPGNATELITVGAWVSKRAWFGCNGEEATFSGTPDPGPLASYSSPGPTRDGRQKPDIAAPGLAIASAATDDVAKTCPAPPFVSAFLPDGMSHVINSGTSLAAAHASGAVALLLARFGAMTPAEVRSYLSSHARVDAFTGSVWNPDWGHGKLFLEPQLLDAPEGSHAIELAIRSLQPNPTSGASTVSFALPRSSWIRLSVLDLQGRRIAVIKEGRFEAGWYHQTWDGLTLDKPVRAGLYFVLLEGSGQRSLQRLVVTR